MAMGEWVLLHSMGDGHGEPPRRVGEALDRCTQVSKNTVHYTVPYSTVLKGTVHYCTVLYCTVLYCMYCTVLNCTVLCCTVLYCTVLEADIC